MVQLQTVHVSSYWSTPCFCHDALAACSGVQGGKHFRASYLELWDRIVRECQAQEALDDDYLLDKVTTLIIGLNWSGPSPARIVHQAHTHWLPAMVTAHPTSLSAFRGARQYVVLNM